MAHFLMGTWLLLSLTVDLQVVGKKTPNSFPEWKSGPA